MANFTLANSREKTNYRMYMDRDLSTLDFNRRVLRLINNPEMDLREKFKFINIVYDNLDEFIAVRLPELNATVRSLAIAELEDIYEEMGNKVDSIFKEIGYRNHVVEYHHLHDIPVDKGTYVYSYGYTKDKVAYMRFISRKSLKYIYTGGTVSNVVEEMEYIAKIKNNMVPNIIQIYTESTDMHDIYSICRELSIPTPILINVPFLIVSLKEFNADKIFGKKESSDKSDNAIRHTPIDSKAILTTIRNKDVFINNPFDSYDRVVDFIEALCIDKDVYKICISLYRVNKDGRIISSLCKAASEYGKTVWVYIEPTARGNELENIDIINILSKHEVEVSCCYNSYKVHAKMCVGICTDGKILTHLGTGNYNEKTSELYTDMHLLTADSSIGGTVLSVFRSLFLGKGVPFSNMYIPSDKLFVAPIAIRAKLNELIDRETAKREKGYIRMKCNSLCDTEIIDKLYRASDMGVKIELIIRTSIGLYPTNNIHIKSKVGKYLEHERFFIFGYEDDSDMEVFISSADLLTRNLDKRIECMTKITSRDIAVLDIIGKFHDEWSSDIDVIL